MKKSFYKVSAAVLAMALAACSSDELTTSTTPGTTGSGNSTDVAYMSVTVQLPTGGQGTRSQTTNNGGATDEHEGEGTEIGKDYENKVNSVLLVLADKDNKFIACGEKTEKLSQTSGGQLSTIQSISKEKLVTYYDNYGKNGQLDDTEIRVYVFCNPTARLRTMFANFSDEPTATEQMTTTTWYDRVCNITETDETQDDGSSVIGATNETIWGGVNHQGGFLMASAKVAKKSLPKDINTWDEFGTIATPFHLSAANGDREALDNTGAIEVERSVARFDFKDGSPNKDNTYHVVVSGDPAEAHLVDVELETMSLVNMSSQFYYLRRVSQNGLAAGYTLCGLETPTNYVVDADAAEKEVFAKATSWDYYNKNFNFPLYSLASDKTSWIIDSDTRIKWSTSVIRDVLAQGEDDHEEWAGTENHDDYKIWRYVTENTIPASTDNQKTAVSTGVVFRGKLKASETAPESLKEALANVKGNSAEDPILYTYGREFFVSWEEVRATALERGTGDDLYIAVFGKDCKVTPVAYQPATEASEDTPATAEIPAEYSDDKESADYLWNQWYNVNKKATGASLTNFKKAATGNDFTLYESSLSDESKQPGYYCYYFYWNRHNDNNKPTQMGAMEFGVVRNNVYKLSVTNISRLGHPRLTENDPDPVDPDDPDEDAKVYFDVNVEVLPWTVRINNITF